MFLAVAVCMILERLLRLTGDQTRHTVIKAQVHWQWNRLITEHSNLLDAPLVWHNTLYIHCHGLVYTVFTLYEFEPFPSALTPQSYHVQVEQPWRKHSIFSPLGKGTCIEVLLRLSFRCLGLTILKSKEVAVAKRIVFNINVFLIDCQLFVNKCWTDFPLICTPI